MNSEYYTLSQNGIESNILFFGQEKCQPGYAFRGNNIRDNYVLHYILAGQGDFSVAGHKTVSLKAGDFFLLPKGVACFYQASFTNPWHYAWIGLTGIKIANIFAASKLAGNYYLKATGQSNFAKSFQRLFEVLHQKTSLVNNLLVENLTYEMFYHLVTEFPHTNTDPSQNRPAQQFELAVRYLENNYTYNCTIEDLCVSLSLSRSYIYNLFQKFAHTSPKKLLTQMRMEDAKSKLTSSNQSIQEIADLVGYHDTFTFSKAFKRYSGYSPSTYRKHFS